LEYTAIANLITFLGFQRTVILLQLSCLTKAILSVVFNKLTSLAPNKQDKELVIFCENEKQLPSSRFLRMKSLVEIWCFCQLS